MIAVICIGLLIGGFLWWPLWLGLVGYIIYLVKTGKQRRSDLVQDYLEQMMRERRRRSLVRNLYFEAAQAFAQDRGGRMFSEDQDTISCTVVIFGEPYSVTFMRAPVIGGTHIYIGKYTALDGSSVENLRKSEEDFLNEIGGDLT